MNEAGPYFTLDVVAGVLQNRQFCNGCGGRKTRTGFRELATGGACSNLNLRLMFVVGRGRYPWLGPTQEAT